MAPDPAETGARRGGRLYYGWRVVLALGVTETTSWGILYYAFTVFLAPMEADLGWSRTAISGAFSVALIVAGAAALPVGRWLDRRGPRLLMTAGSLAGALLVLAWSAVRELPAFYLIWAAIGATMATVLYEPAFAVVAVWFDRRRAEALTALTLMAGFASTIFIPLAGWLVERQGWREALATLAVLQAATAVPHALVLRRRPEDLGLDPDGDARPRAGGNRAEAAGMPLRRTLGDRAFRWLAAGFALNTFAMVAVAVHLVPYLVGRGLSPATAAAAAGLVGAMQVAGRLAFAPLERRAPRALLATAVLLVQPAALLALLLVPGAAGVYGFIALFGMGRGATTLTRATLVAARYGAARYGSVSGALALFVTLAQAAAPVAMGAGYDLAGGYDPVLWVLAALSVAAAAAVGRGERAPAFGAAARPRPVLEGRPAGRAQEGGT